MSRKNLLFLFMLIVFSRLSLCQDPYTPKPEELKKLNDAVKTDTNLSRLISYFGEPDELFHQYKINLARADSIWEQDQKTMQPLENIGTTRQFEMLPLIDWFTDNDKLHGESGVSYLIRTDEATILFDLGLNTKDAHPSPLLHNMEKLGIEMDEIDLIVISHNHGDHVGGNKWSEAGSFSLTGHQIDLPDIPVYTPNEMHYPGLSPTYTPKPVKIAKGVTTIGVIHNPVLFVDIAEQALAVNVKDKGIVVISGCGHQSIHKIVERTAVLFDEPLYGLLGGFHLPVEEGRNIGWIYKYIVVDKLPWERLTVDDIYTNINLLKSKDIKLVGISAHDSCDKTISYFKKAFGEMYKEIVVGETIIL